MFLTREQLYDLTGYKHSSKQVAWLRAHRYKFDVNAAGRPIVHVGHVESRLGAGKPPAPEPDFSVFQKG